MLAIPPRLSQEEKALQQKFNQLKKKKKRALLAPKKPRSTASQRSAKRSLSAQRVVDAATATEQAKQLVKSGAIRAIKAETKNSGFKRPRTLERKLKDPEKKPVPTFQSFQRSPCAPGGLQESSRSPGGKSVHESSVSSRDRLRAPGPDGERAQGPGAGGGPPRSFDWGYEEHGATRSEVSPRRRPDRSRERNRDLSREWNMEPIRDWNRDRSRERNRDRSREWNMEPIRDWNRDRSRERNQDRSRERNRDLSREWNVEPIRDWNRDPYHERNQDRSRERNRGRSRERNMEPIRDWNRDRSRERNMEPIRDWNRDRSRERNMEPIRDWNRDPCHERNQDRSPEPNRGRSRKRSRGLSRERERVHDRERERDQDRKRDRDRDGEGPFRRSDWFPERRARRRGHTLYVYGEDLTPTLLRGAFSPFGNIIDLSMDPPKNRAFVTYEKMESADQAVAELSGTQAESVRFKVSIARRQPMLDRHGQVCLGLPSVQNSPKDGHRDKRTQIAYSDNGYNENLVDGF